MAYLGRQPISGNFVKLDAITTSATTTFNLLNGGVSYYPQSANNCIVSLNGVIQSPTSAYTISGSTIVFSDALTSSDTIDFILVLGDVLSIGTPSDGTITPSKLSTGVAGLISWQSVQTSGFTAVAGRGYPCNTTSSAFTVTLPASPSAGDTIILLDYAGTFATNALTLGANGLKIQSQTSNVIASKNNEALTLTYIDSTSGWLVTSSANEGTSSINLPYSVDFLIVAGGGSGGTNGGGGGAGGYRNSYSTETSGGGGSSETELSFTAGTVYTVTVGAGGSGGLYPTAGNNGNNSSISGTGITTITSTGGGRGGSETSNSAVGQNGGSGGGGGYPNSSGGNGTSNQGYNGSASQNSGNHYGGGGGAGEAGGTDGNGYGGDGLDSSITGSAVTRGGGGAGSNQVGTVTSVAGTGGGGSASNGGTAGSGTANTGGGGGGSSQGSGTSGAGGSGVVILRMPTAKYSGTTTGSPTVTTSGSDTIITFNASGSITG